MKAVLQRVTKAEVRVDDQVVGAIGAGLLVLVGVARGDADADAEWLAEKIARLRIFEVDGKFSTSLVDRAGSVLLVSQFTLLASTRKGRRPGFAAAADPPVARQLICRLGERLNRYGLVVESGRFGAKMEVDLINDGPVTILLDSADRAVAGREAAR